MRHSIQPRERKYVKVPGFLSFVRNTGKNMSNKYGQKLADNAKKSATNAIKTASKRAIQKTAEVPRDLVGKKIAGKITNASKKSMKKPHDEESSSHISHLNLEQKIGLK